jgi:uncharacterized membrane protein YhaH (DUF805 family)
MTTTTTASHSTDVSKLEAAGIVGAAANAIGTFLVIVGRMASWKGFTPDDNDTSTLGAVAVFLFGIGLLLTLGITVALLVRRRRSSVTRTLCAYVAADLVLTALFGLGAFG